MRDRRRRILLEVQKLLEESPMSGFTMRDIGRRAGVAHRTLYNMFGTKEEIITAAIEDHFLNALAQAPPPTSASPDLLESMLQHIEARGSQVLGLRPYAAAMVAIFFSPTVDHRLHDSLFRLSRMPYERWLEQAVETRLIRPLAAPEREMILVFVTNLAFANIGDVLADRVSPRQFWLRAQIAFLTVIRPFMAGPARKTLDVMLADLQRVYRTLPEEAGTPEAEGA